MKQKTKTKTRLPKGKKMGAKQMELHGTKVDKDNLAMCAERYVYVQEEVRDKQNNLKIEEIALLKAMKDSNRPSIRVQDSTGKKKLVKYKMGAEGIAVSNG